MIRKSQIKLIRYDTVMAKNDLMNNQNNWSAVRKISEAVPLKEIYG